MANRIAVSNLNASTIEILNVIRQNADASYQALVPQVTKATDIPKVGEVLYGYPALANQFLSALVNRIAAVKVKSATFNNAYAELKKGVLGYGETVEEVFVNITKARPFSAEKAAGRELKRTLPDVKAAFHIMNFKVEYPITIQREDLRMAFTGPEGVTDLIAKIVSSIYTAAEYDEFLLFKYLIIKAVTGSHTKLVNFDPASITDAAVKFRATSNQMTFMSSNFNEAGVLTTTDKDDQYIFMDSDFNAEYDVNVLAAAFNMDKTDFMGHLKLIDSFTTFDNDRFSEIVGESDTIETVTPAELNTMSSIKAILVDKEWFQIYDNLMTMTETPVNSGLYWNYFYHTWKTVSYSPFSNCVAFAANSRAFSYPSKLNVNITQKEVSDDATILTFEVDPATLIYGAEFVTTKAMVQDGTAMHKYGAMIIPNANAAKNYNLVVQFNDGTQYLASTTINASSAVDDVVSLDKQ